jgi:hypothetical protein
VEIVSARASEAESPTGPRLVIVTAVPSAARVQRVKADLERDFPQLELASADVLRQPAAMAVYVFCFDAAIGVVLANDIATWTGHGAGIGLIGVIEDGGSNEREALLVAGFDDVITGGLSTRELAVRVRAVHRRLHWGGSRQGRMRFAAFTLGGPKA